MSRTYLAHHELESVVVVVFIIIIILVIMSVIIIIIIIVIILFTRAAVGGDAGVLLVRLCGTVNGILATTLIWMNTCWNTMQSRQVLLLQ